MELSRLPTYHACILQARAYRSLREFMVVQLKQHKLSMMEWVLLGVVHDAGVDGITHTKIAEMIDVGLPMVTNMVDRVEGEGLIERTASPLDKRHKIVVVTQKGEKAINDTEQGIRIALAQWLKDIPRSELVSYVGVMSTLAELPIPEGKTVKT